MQGINAKEQRKGASEQGTRGSTTDDGTKPKASAKPKASTKPKADSIDSTKGDSQKETPGSGAKLGDTKSAAGAPRSSEHSSKEVLVRVLLG